MNKLDELSDRLSRIELGQQVTYDDIDEEIQTLKKLLTKLGKKDWQQLLKGKLLDAGLGHLSSTITGVLIDVFKDGKLLS